MKKKVAAFDLEGPLSPMDHAMEVMRIVPEGEKVFAVLSRYDDLLTLEGRVGYEPGDTLVLILPFLLFHRIKPEDLIEASKKAGLIKGSKELVSELKKDGWYIYIISTSYCQHAQSIGERLDIEKENIYCTDLKKMDFNKRLDKETSSLLKETENYILSNLYSDGLDSGGKDLSIKPYLDRFFWHELKSTAISSLMDEIKVMGGTRKKEALKEIAEINGVSLSKIVAVGDSITDFPMLKAVNEAGGLAIVFNGNEFSLPYGTASVASTDLRDIRLLMDRWVENGREGVKQAILLDSRLQTPDSRLSKEQGYYHWLEGVGKEEMNEILKLHKEFRKKVRGEITARLG
ncbi:MAG: HAD hydrolase family protein [Nitrospirota bacterium]|jgi:energy-converting hydrogenase A subunit R